MLPPALIASDIDGTLLNSDYRVPRRNRDALTRASAAGAEVALATGRPFRWIGDVLDQLTVRPVCATSNGAVLYDSATDTVLAKHELSPAVMAAVVEAASVLPPFAVGAERAGTSVTDAPEDLFVVSPGFNNTWEEQGFGEARIDDVISAPAVKLILRNEFMTAPQMYELIAPLIDPSQAHITYSMNEGLLEVAAPGVTKALGMQHLCSLHDISQSRTIAFGDMPNDIEMLQWVNHGVAVANAHPDVKAAADEVGVGNGEGALGHVLERWF